MSAGCLCWIQVRARSQTYAILICILIRQKTIRYTHSFNIQELFWMDNKTVIEWGWVSSEELWRFGGLTYQPRPIRASADNTLLDLYNSTVDTKPLSIIVIYYSFKIFPRFWLAKGTRIIHLNQLLMTKFGRILRVMNRWRQRCNFLAG